MGENFWPRLSVALAIGALYFRDLGDASQMLLKVKRENMLRFIRNEYRLLEIGLGALAVATIAALLGRSGIFEFQAGG
jgi:hypothetical protein